MTQKDLELIEATAKYLDAALEEERKELIEKACDAYCKVCGHYPHTVPIHICRHDCDYFSNFKEAMTGE